MRRLFAAVIAIALLASACGGDSLLGAETTAASTPSAPSSTTEPPSTTKPPPTTSTPAPPTTAPGTTSAATTSPPQRTAADALAGTGFFASVEDLDLAIADAAASFNAQWDPDAGTLGAVARNDILALDAAHIGTMIPAGLYPAVEDAALAVFTDLDSRIAALHGAERLLSNSEDVRYCLDNGGESFRRFDDDLMEVYDLATAAPAPPDFAPDSQEAGILAVRLEVIRLSNWGCDSCGGGAYDETLPVDWEGRTVLGGVTFDAEFTDGTWVIRVHAC